MRFVVTETSSGFTLEIQGERWQAPACAFRYPEQVWQGFPAREALISELAYATTMAIPLILGHPCVSYSTRSPAFLRFYHQCFEAAIPNLTEPIASEDSEAILGRFRALRRRFSQAGPGERLRPLPAWNPRRVVLPFSFGKDSLLSLATLTALGWEVVLVIVDERTLPRADQVRRSLEKRLRAEHGLRLHWLENEIQLLSDYQVLGRPETRLYQPQAHFTHLLAMLPFCVAYRAPVIVLNNEYDNSLATVHRQGYLAPRRVMQGTMVTRGMAELVRVFSGGQVRVVNLIGGLGNFAIHWLLHQRFPWFGQYQFSCHLEVCDHDRWCHDCRRCAQAYLHLAALGRDPRQYGFVHSMLTRDQQDLYSSFLPESHPRDRYHRFVRDEEALAFQLLSRRGEREELVDRFRAGQRKRGRLKEGWLRRRVLALQARPGSHPLERQAASFYRAALAEGC